MVIKGFHIAVLAALLIALVQSRENATGAIETFLITECDDCIWDGDSIFCTEGKDNHFVKNITHTRTIADKKAMFGPADGARYCWEGWYISCCCSCILHIFSPPSINIRFFRRHLWKNVEH